MLVLQVKLEVERIGRKNGALVWREQACSPTRAPRSHCAATPASLQLVSAEGLKAISPWSYPLSHAPALELQDKKVFAQHNKFGITIEVEKKFLNYHLKTAETVAKSAETAEKTASPEAVARAARIAAAAKKQAKAKQAAAAKAKAKAKAKASETVERCLLAEAVKAVAIATKAAKAEKAAAAEVKPEAEPAKDQDGAADVARAEATMATADATEAEAARLGAEVALPLVQARSFSAGLATHATRAPVTNLTLTLTRCKWS